MPRADPREEGGALQAIDDLDLDELEAIKPPKGFGISHPRPGPPPPGVAQVRHLPRAPLRRS
jgi:hypothetical protein